MQTSSFFGRALLPDAFAVVNLTPSSGGYEQLVLANAALSIEYLNGGFGSANEVTSLQVRVGSDGSTPWVTVCSLSVSGVKQWSLHNLKFDGRSDQSVCFRVEGPGTIHITGHKLSSNGNATIDNGSSLGSSSTSLVAKRRRSGSIDRSEKKKEKVVNSCSSSSSSSTPAAYVSDGAYGDVEDAVEEEEGEESEEVVATTTKVVKKTTTTNNKTITKSGKQQTVKKTPTAAAQEEEDDDEEEDQEKGNKTKEELEVDANNLKKAKKANKRKRKSEAKAEANRAGGMGGEAPTLKSEKFIGVGRVVAKPKALHKGGGLTIKDTIIGAGPEPTLGKQVKILYEGFLSDGTLFDSKQSKRSPLSFRLGLREVVPGFDKGIQGMKIGGAREIHVPAAMGYGSKKTGPIPPNSDLIFKVELIG